MTADGDSATRPDPIADVHDVLQRLTDTLSRDHDRAAFRESIIDRLHQENQELRRDQLGSMLEPVRAGLYRLHETLRREAARWASPDRPAVEHVTPLLEALADDTVEIIERTGVEPFAANPGERFDPARHRPRQVVEVVDPALADTVIDVLSVGFARGEQVVRRADVTVGRAGTGQSGD